MSKHKKIDVCAFRSTANMAIDIMYIQIRYLITHKKKKKRKMKTTVLHVLNNLCKLCFVSQNYENNYCLC